MTRGNEITDQGAIAGIANIASTKIAKGTNRHWFLLVN